MKPNFDQKNAYTSVEQLFKAAEIKFTPLHLKTTLSSHIDFPSLKSLKDVIEQYKIETLATRISPEQLDEIPLPAIFHLRNGLFCTIKEIAEKSVTVYEENKGWVKEDLNSLISKWDGIALLIEANEFSGENNYSIKRVFEIQSKILNTLFLKIIILISLAYFVYWKATDSSYFAVLVIKILGIFYYEPKVTNAIINNNNEVQKKFSIYDKDLLKYSNGRFVSLYYVGFLYSFTGIIAIIFFPFTVQDFYILGITLLVFVILVSFGFKNNHPIKELGVLLFMALFDISIYFSFNYEKDKIYFHWVPLLLLAIVVFLLGYKLIKKNENLISLKRAFTELLKIKEDILYINSLKEKKKFLPPIFKGMEILETTSVSSNTLTVVLNPACHYSASIFNHLIDSKIYECVTIKFFFITSSFDIEAQFFIEKMLSLSESERLNFSIMWFKEGINNPSTWAKSLEFNEFHTSMNMHGTLHRKWVEIANITALPAIYINDIEYPTIFKIEEIKPFINNHFDT